MTEASFRRYPRNSPQAAGRILAMALLANGDVKAAEWKCLTHANAFERLGLQDLHWNAVMDDLCQDLLASADAGEDCRVGAPTLAAWLDEIDDARLQALLVELCVQVIEADGEVHPGESLVLLAALEQWALPVEDRARLEPLVYGLDFQVLPRRAHVDPGLAHRPRPCDG